MESGFELSVTTSKYWSSELSHLII